MRLCHRTFAALRAAVIGTALVSAADGRALLVAPQQVTPAPGAPLLPLAGTIQVETSDASSAMSDTREFLLSRLTACGYRNVVGAANHARVRLQLLAPDEPLPAEGLPSGIAPFARMGDEGYALSVTPETSGARIVVAAATDHGIFDGAMTLLELLLPYGVLPGSTVPSPTCAPVTSIPAESIRDYPDLPIRAAYADPVAIDCAGACSLRAGATAELDRLARLKIDTVFMSSGFPAASPAVWDSWIARFDELQAYAAKRQIEIVPSLWNLQSYGSVAYRDGWFVQDEPFVFSTTTDEAVFAGTGDRSPANRIANGEFELPTGQGLWLDGQGRAYGNWTLGSGAGAVWTRDCTQAHGGVCSMRLDATSGDASATLEQYVPGPLPPGHYLLTAWLKTGALAARASDGAFDGPRLTAGIQSSTGYGGYLPALKSIAVYPVDAPGHATWARHAFVLRVPQGSTGDRAYVVARFAAGTGSVWLDDVRLKRIDGDLKNVLTKSYPLRVASSAGRVYVEGVDYVVTPGTLETSYADGPTPSTIVRLPGGAIPPGASVFVRYDKALFWGSEDPWAPGAYTDGRAEEQGQNVCGSVLLDEIYLPALQRLLTAPAIPVRSVNLISDEIRGFNRSGACRDASGAVLESNAQVLAGFFTRVVGAAKALRPAVRFYAWSDMFSPVHNGGMPTYQQDLGTTPSSYDLAGSAGATFCALDPASPRCVGEAVTAAIGPELRMNLWTNTTRWVFQKNAAARFFDAQARPMLLTSTAESDDAAASLAEWAAIAGATPSVLGLLRDPWDSPVTEAWKAQLGWKLLHDQVLFEPFEFGLPDTSPDRWMKSDHAQSEYAFGGSAQFRDDRTCTDDVSDPWFGRATFRRHGTDALPVNAGGVCFGASGGSLTTPAIPVENSATYRVSFDSIRDPAASGAVRFHWRRPDGNERVEDVSADFGGHGAEFQRVSAEAAANPPGTALSLDLRVEIVGPPGAKLDNLMVWRSHAACPDGPLVPDAPTVTVTLAGVGVPFSAPVRVRNALGCRDLRITGVQSGDGYGTVSATPSAPLIVKAGETSYRTLTVTGYAPTGGSADRTVQVLSDAGASFPVTLHFVAGGCGLIGAEPLALGLAATGLGGLRRRRRSARG